MNTSSIYTLILTEATPVSKGYAVPNFRIRRTRP